MQPWLVVKVVPRLMDGKLLCRSRDPGQVAVDEEVAVDEVVVGLMEAVGEVDTVVVVVAEVVAVDLTEVDGMEVHTEAAVAVAVDLTVDGMEVRRTEAVEVVVVEDTEAVDVEVEVDTVVEVAEVVEVVEVDLMVVVVEIAINTSPNTLNLPVNACHVALRENRMLYHHQHQR